MDTTAAAELGMGEPEGAAFWDAGSPGLDQWSDQGHDDMPRNRPRSHAGADISHNLQQSNFGSGRAVGGEDLQSGYLMMLDGTHQHSSGGPSHHSSSGVPCGYSGATSLGRGNFSTARAAGAESPNFDTVGLYRWGGGALGSGRGVGSLFYKTKLCCRFRSGNCPYNTNCNFAHGLEELRRPPAGWEEFVASQEVPPPTSSQPGGQGGSGAAAGSMDSQIRFHKTRPCKKYFGEGNCPYGDKCNFLHDEQSVPRAVREAREAAVAASGSIVATSSKVETVVPTTNGNVSETGGAHVTTPAAISNGRLLNWKTRLCNKWETTGHCPLGDNCHFAHGSDELQRSWGGLPNTYAPAFSDSIVMSSHQRHQGGGSSARAGSKGNLNWRGPNEISTIYGDWCVEEGNWKCGGTTTSHESSKHKGDVWREAKRRTPLSATSSSTQTIPFFRLVNSLEPSRQNVSLTNGCAIISQQDGRLHKQTSQYEGLNAMGKEGSREFVLQPEHGWRSELT